MNPRCGHSTVNEQFISDLNEEELRYPGNFLLMTLMCKKHLTTILNMLFAYLETLTYLFNLKLLVLEEATTACSVPLETTYSDCNP